MGGPTRDVAVLDRGRITLDELRASVGTEVGVSRWFNVDQDVIDTYAGVSGDHQYIHVDPRRAGSESPFGGTIAHGFLTLSLLPAMKQDALPDQEGVRMSLDYGFDKIRFLSPVRCGSRVRGRFVLYHLDEQTENELTLTWDTVVEIENGVKPALAAVWITRRYLFPQS